MQITLHIDGPDGDRKLSASPTRAEKTEALLGELSRATLTLDRSDWRDIDAVLDRRADELVVDANGESPWFAGRFDDDTATGDATIELTIAGYERDAKDAEPTGDNVVYQNTADSQIVQDLIDPVPTLSPGSIDTIDSALSMSFSYANPSKALRDVEEAGGGELRYNDDGTIDYTGRVGSDKPGVVISAAEQTLIGEPELVEDGRESITHLRGFGAQSGPDQVTEVVTSDAYDGGRETWREYENKDIKSQSRLESVLEQRMAEIQAEQRHIEVEATAVGVSVELGDRVTVRLPEEGVDALLRVISRTEIAEATGVSFVLTLSNRLRTKDDRNRKARKDLQRFNRGYEGFVGRDNLGAGAWQLVGDGVDAGLPYRYPDDVEEEISVTLDVEGRAWRSPVTPKAHDHSVSIGSHAHSVDIPSHQHDVTISVPDHIHGIHSINNTVTRITESTDSHSHDYLLASETAPPSSASTNSETSDSGGETTETTSGGGSTTTTTDDVTPLSPAITTQFDGNKFYPEVDILVNGDVVATAIGDSTGSWHTTLDTELEGVLTPGRNEITAEAANGTRGEVMLALTTELFRRGRE